MAFRQTTVSNMAELNFYEGDSDENSDAGEEGSLGVGSDGYDSDSSNPDSGLSPLQKLEKYMNSEHSYSRQMVARGLFETLKSLEELQEDTEKVFQAMAKLSGDQDSSVRAEIGEQVIRMAEYFRKKPDTYCTTISEYLLPILIMYFKDLSIPVRKTSENTMLLLVKEKQVTDEEFESKVAPVILEMSEPESMDDFRTEAVVLMTKFAPMLGCDITKRVFLTRFTQMCGDALFHVRKVCASNFGDMCQVVGQEVTEKFLLPKFFYLCEDGVWGVRNACAECFMQVANICSPEVRRDELSMLFVRLLCDQSRWVRMAAFQALGGFISTFATPEFTGLVLTEDGQLISRDFREDIRRNSSSADDHEVFSEHQLMSDSPHENASPKVAEHDLKPNISSSCSSDVSQRTAASTANCLNSSSVTADTGCPGYVESSINAAKLSSKVSSESTELKLSNCVTLREEDDFDLFHYWRIPPIVVENFDMTSDGRLIDCSFKTNLPCRTVCPISSEPGDSCRTADFHSLSDACPVENSSETTANQLTSIKEAGNSLLNKEPDRPRRHLVEAMSTDITSVTSYGSESCFSGCVDVLNDSDITSCRQNIVPLELLDHYLSMADSSRAQTVDAEITRHCAFSFPAVAYTLGRQNWCCLKELYETLARDMQWKVRRTLAFSIHELAFILGAKITSSDLLPIFDDFLKDLDEVRVGALKHMAEFLKLLSPDMRRKYLLKFPSFLETDNTRNWRFRLDLAEQLLLILDLFSPTDVQEHLCPLTMTLAEDKVAQVRLEALKVLSGIAKCLSLDVLGQLWSDFVSEINERFAHSNNWCRRQSFVYFCDCLLKTEAIDKNRFVADFLPTLLKLGTDSVPNIRLAVARILRQYITTSDFFLKQKTAELNDLIEHLKSDKDRDVHDAITSSSQMSALLSADSDKDVHMMLV